jgi:spermidine synthase
MEQGTQPGLATAAHSTAAGAPLLITALFFFSGFASLAYEVTWVRLLSLFFGSDVYSAAITLGTFMAGLAFGSWIASVFADRGVRVLVLYGVLEIATGVAALLVPDVLDAFHGTYKSVYNDYAVAAPSVYHVFRIAVAAATLLVPTTLMGATLPLLVRYVVRDQRELGRGSGTLYAVNTLGALTGTLVTGFILLPQFGTANSVQIAVAVSVAVGVIAAAIGWREGVSAAAQDVRRYLAPADRSQRRILATIALSGMGALALEVVWMRVLVQSFSGTVYAFSIMLACFLFGIFYGSRKASSVADRVRDPAGVLAALVFGLGVATAVLAVLTYVVPGLFSGLVWGLTGATGGAFGVSSVVGQLVIASLLILGPTILLGATYPFAVKAFTPDVRRRASGAGKVYAANTAGAIVGSLLGGFVVLPGLGARPGLLAVAGLFLATGLWFAASLRRPGVAPPPMRRRTIVWGLATFAVAGVAALLLPPQTIVNYGLQKSSRPEIVYHGEGTAHTVTVARNDAGTTVMMVNGNIEADTSLTQRRHFVLKAYLPLLLNPRPARIGVVGLGLGITLRSAARYPWVEHIQVIELAPEMVRAHRHLASITGDVLANPKVKLRIDDARNFMAMTDETFDVITADPIHPRITGVGYLYTTEYYNAIRSRLNPGGVVTQWMPMYNISPRSFDVAFRTFAQVFPNATFWYVRGHGLLAATLAPAAIDCHNVTAGFESSPVAEDFASIDIASPVAFLAHLLMDSDHIARYLARDSDGAINTDDNAYLEYRTPYEFLARTEAIVGGLLPYAGWDTARTLRGCDDATIRAVRRAFEERIARIPVELQEPLR